MIAPQHDRRLSDLLHHLSCVQASAFAFLETSSCCIASAIARLRSSLSSGSGPCSRCWTTSRRACRADSSWSPRAPPRSCAGRTAGWTTGWGKRATQRNIPATLYRGVNSCLQLEEGRIELISCERHSKQVLIRHNSTTTALRVCVLERARTSTSWLVAHICLSDRAQPRRYQLFTLCAPLVFFRSQSGHMENMQIQSRFDISLINNQKCH